MNVIFLDVDGVLNFIGSEARIHRDMYFIEDEKIELLKEIVEATDAVLVLSSSWRRGWSLPPGEDNRKQRADMEDSESYFMLCAKLHEFGLGLLSEIPRLKNGNREAAILYWLQSWPGERIKGYAILDDDATMFSKGNKHLVLTSPDKGLEEKHKEEVINILRG